MLHEKSNIRMTVLALLLGILMAAMDSSVVSTAMGTVVADLGGLETFVWVTAAYMIATVAGMPIFGKLSDMYGRKRFYVVGLVLFMAGSVLCGLAGSMIQLSVFRAIQGLGGGALMPIAFTIVIDVFPPEERGKMTGLFSAVFGLSSILGPVLGALLTEYLSWHWVFFINVPLGLISLAMILRYYHEALPAEERVIDWAGAVLLVAAVVSLMFSMQMGGQVFPWTSPIIQGLAIMAVAMVALFVWNEGRAADPVLPPEMFRRQLFTSTQIISFFSGAAFIVSVTYIPIYIQGVIGGSASTAGMVLTPMMLATVVGSQWGGTRTVKRSYRQVLLVAGVLLLAGSILLATLTPDTSKWLLILYVFILGCGIGVTFPVLSMSSIHDLPFNMRGTANSAVAFFRLIGMTIGIGIMGTVQRSVLADEMSRIAAGASGVDPRFMDPGMLLKPEMRSLIPDALLQPMTAALCDSIVTVFLISVIPAAAALLAIFFMGGASLLDLELVAEPEQEMPQTGKMTAVSEENS